MAGDFISHDGGPMTVDSETVVIVRFYDGAEYGPEDSSGEEWRNCCGIDCWNWNDPDWREDEKYKIVEYKIVDTEGEEE